MIRSFACIFALLAASTAMRGEDTSRFDAVAKSVGPIISLLTPNGSNGNHALNIEAAVGDISGLPDEWKGARIRIAFEFPDKLLVQFPLAGSMATICRNGQSVWAYPSTLFAPIVDQIGATFSPQPLPPFQIDQQKATLLPALLDVHDSGIVKLGNESFRVLDLRAVSNDKKKQSDGWPARIWIRPADHRIAQLALRFKNWSVTAAIQKLEFAPALPPATWNPPPEQQGQVIAVPGEKIGTLLENALKQRPGAG